MLNSIIKMGITNNKKGSINSLVSSMAPYAPYVDTIEKLACELITSPRTALPTAEIELVLDGQPMKSLRDVISISDLRNSGTFFTHHDLANRLVKSIIPDIKEGVPICDPACGTGNLLLACARHLPIMQDIKETILVWGKQIHGYDIHPEFIKATKLRLILLAIERGAEGTLTDVDIDNVFPYIQNADYLSNPLLSKGSSIVINPPYSIVQAPPKCSWASGIISNAALFIESCVKTAKAGTKIVSLLPDVLRTGSRYSKWREEISKRVRIESIEIIGQFDELTDIDVFLFRMTIVSSTKNQVHNQWWNFSGPYKKPENITSDFFNVHVGPVVPYRDPHKGKWYPYIHARLLPSWTTINTDISLKKRRYFGTTYKPPFVVVRRTSSPNDNNRAIGSIIVGNREVAVENHLLILKPISEKLVDCKQLLKYLRSNSVNEWLNKRIRCRHLTVSSLRELPLDKYDY